MVGPNTSPHALAADEFADTGAYPYATDVALMRRAAQGEAEGQQELAERLVRRIRRAAHALVHGSADADDAAQHALIEALRAARTYRGGVSVERWADPIVGRSIIRFARAVRRRTGDSGAPAQDVIAVQHGERPPRDLDETLARLSESAREVLLLRHAFGLSVDEIAELTRASPDTVRERLLGARRELRKFVAQRSSSKARAEATSSIVERWAALRDREAVGDTLTEPELTEATRVEAEERALRDYVAQTRELERYLDDARSGRLSGAERELVRRALSAVQVTSPSARVRAIDHDAELASSVDPEGPGWIRVAALATSVGLAATAALALVFYEPRSVRRASSVEPVAIELDEPALTPRVEALASAHTSARGSRLRRAGKVLPPEAPLSQGDEIRAGDRPGCLHVATHIELCLSPGSTVQLKDLTASTPSVSLWQGRMSANLPAQSLHTHLTVLVGDVTVLARSGVFGVERDQDASYVRVRSLRGGLTVQAQAQELPLPEGRVAVYRSQEGVLDAVDLLPFFAQRDWDLVALREPAAASLAGAASSSSTAVRGSSDPNSPPQGKGTSALQSLMQAAWEHLEAERWAEAAATYERIAEEHPSSAEAHSVLVRWADLLLERLSAPERALAIFERYLNEGGGPLAAEARHGRIAALRRLWRAADERTAIEEFLRAHPEHAKAEMLKVRLRVLAESASEAPNVHAP